MLLSFLYNNRLYIIISLACSCRIALEWVNKSGVNVMQLHLGAASEAKLEDILEELYARYDLSDVTAEGLVEALIDIGLQVVVTESVAPSVMRDRLLSKLTQMQRLADF